MAEPNIFIASVTLTPNPVQAGKTFICSADVRPIKYVLDAGEGTALDTGYGTMLQIKD